ncbi:sigma factor [Acaryochloris sp. CCMEE 5410]|uniref:sigma factor n=1 Tax=Acaryochloris sp. CCMEE 5410 TaxID=310037 RepID=UPI0021CE20A6|nr:sigma factor [Acaryochloris sp. CCMEE 5410]KAI9130210.1 sigma-70 family RNA polymerase sigma factor [Acaryochloris sp. CCMEE 5410]
MTYTTPFPTHQGKQLSDRRYLTTDEQLALVSQVQARTLLLKQKKAGLTLEETRICLRGERALKALVEGHHKMIWLMIHRFNFSDRLTTDELFQIGIITIEKAANYYNPTRPGRYRRFSSWVFFLLRQKFRNLFKQELGYEHKRKTLYGQLRMNAPLCNHDTPQDFAILEELKQLLKPLSKTLSFKSKSMHSGPFTWTVKPLSRLPSAWN